MSIEARIRHWRAVMSELGLLVVGVDQGKHLKFWLSDGQVVVMSKTPTDHRGDRNTLARLRRLAPRDDKPKTYRVRRKPPPKPQPEPVKPVKLVPEGPQKVQCALRRVRLGLDGRRTPEAKRFDVPGRAILSLRGAHERPHCRPTGDPGRGGVRDAGPALADRGLDAGGRAALPGDDDRPGLDRREP